jgi:hypothetical protein
VVALRVDSLGRLPCRIKESSLLALLSLKAIIPLSMQFRYEERICNLYILSPPIQFTMITDLRLIKFRMAYKDNIPRTRHYWGLTFFCLKKFQFLIQTRFKLYLSFVIYRRAGSKTIKLTNKEKTRRALLLLPESQNDTTTPFGVLYCVLLKHRCSMVCVLLRRIAS